MARGVGRTGCGRAVFSELQQNADPPQSTLAAQLVNHFTDGKEYPKKQDHEVFKQLLQEILCPEIYQQSQTAAQETDDDVNYKLIFVIVRAGLEIRASDDPFAESSHRQRQAIDSLAAVESTIKRSPDALFIVAPARDAGPSCNGPLYLWLIPRLLNLIGQSRDDILGTEVLRLLRTTLTLEQKTHTKGIKPHAIRNYIKGNIEDLLRYIETSMSEASGFQNVPQPQIPSATTLLRAYPDNSPDAAALASAQISLRSRPHAINIVCHLLALISGASSKSYDTQQLRGSIPGKDYWKLNAMIRLWHAIGPEDVQPKLDQISAQSLVLFLESLRSSCSRRIAIRPTSSMLVRFSSVLAQATTTLLSGKILPLASCLEKSLCVNLIEIASLGQISNYLHQNVFNSVVKILTNLAVNRERYEKLGHDLKHTVELVIRLYHDFPAAWHKGLPLPSFHDVEIRDICQSRFYDFAPECQSLDVQRPQKRPRLSCIHKGEPPLEAREQIVGNIRTLLGLEEDTEFTRMCHVAADCFPNLPEEKQCSLLSSIGLAACASNQSLVRVSMGDSQSRQQLKCHICDDDWGSTSMAAMWGSIDSEEAISTIATLIKLPKTQKARRPRVAAMLALRRLLSHTPNAEHLNLTTSPFGQWCLQALRSSTRELRLAAGRTLPVFLQGTSILSVIPKNRIVALDYLRSLSEQCDLSLQETCILAWGHVARVSGGDEMNLVLLRLVEYLGHTNSLICGLAYDEIQRMSNHSPFSAMKLFAPYWRTIAVSVIQDLHRRPQIAQQISDLLAMSVSDFLSMTQVYTVPFLVLTKKQDILQRIADACGQTIMSLCREHNNLAAILSCVLLRTSSDVEDLVMALLNAVSPEFSNVDCSELLRSEPQATASELLRAAGEDDEVMKTKAHHALHFLAGVTHGKPTSSRGSARKIDVIGPFFETHVLGIMALLADTINDGKGPQPTLEKIRCLGAIREMIRLARSHVTNGLPQICGCLRSAIENKELSNQGFDAWIVMINTLGEDEVAPLVDPTFAILIQNWDSLLPEMQARAYDMISYMIKSHPTMIRDLVHTLPSLASIPLMAKFEEDLSKLKAQMDVKHHFQAFSLRCQSENATVVLRALDELARYLAEHQDFLHETANSEQPDVVVAQLARAILDTSVLFSGTDPGISVLCAKCMGYVGCLDPTRIEAIKEKRDILALSNFVRDDETNDFIVFFLREVLVKAFLSATNSRSQGFLAYAMQELLSISEIKESVRPRSRDGPYDSNYRRWVSLPESVRTTLMPFTDSKYFVTAGVSQPPCAYPLYRAETGHAQWLRTFTFDLLKKNLGGPKVQTIFSVLSRIVRFQDISISSFLLPFACLNVIVSGSDYEKTEIGQELLFVLGQALPDHTSSRDNIITCSQTVFQVLDYLSRWMHEKKKELANVRNPNARTGRSPNEVDLERDVMQTSSVEAVLAIIPADVISRRAVECKSYSRALFHWEQYIRQQRDQHHAARRVVDLEPLYERLQEIYTQIDEPDGIEGISAHLQVLNIDQQILEHRKAGRWTAVQSWYELQLTEKPNDLEVQYSLLTSLKESGQYDVLLNQVDNFQESQSSKLLSLPFAVEASWVTGKWAKLKHYLSLSVESSHSDFNIGVGQALVALSEHKLERFSEILEELRGVAARGLSPTNISSLQACHESQLKFHVLTEMEMITAIKGGNKSEKSRVRSSLNLRLNALGPFLSDKQYILGVRRAVMQLSKQNFSSIDIASSWLTTARLARKGDFMHQAFNAVLHASQLGDDSATIEHSRLLWKEGNHRKAIQSLEGAIAANAFRSHDYTEADVSMTTINAGTQQNLLTARAHLLLAKWIDRAGQTQSDVIIHQYKTAADYHSRWEKGHYYLGKHYNKLLESEKAKPPAKQSQIFINGEISKLVVENYLRSLAFGTKYIYQSLPKLLTLWLDLGADTEQILDPKYGNDDTFRAHTMAQRRKLLGATNSQVKKYIDRLPAFVFYTAFSQLVARICHPSNTVFTLIVDMVAKVVIQHTAQALWTLLAVVKSSNSDRAKRGVACITRVHDNARKAKNDTLVPEIRSFIAQGQKISDQLLHVCEGGIEGKPSHISLSKDLGFNHKAAPCKLVMPIEQCLTASLPTVTDNVNMRHHKAFGDRAYIHISSFLDDVLVLNSLQKPRKISIRGSDGHVYALLCKPKDDLRKDQRLMEFNAMINRALKKDAESSKRRLYIKTYAVTPLNEECGLIEWIDNLKTLRDILLTSYKQKSIQINYMDIKNLLTEAISAPGKLSIFTDRIIPHFPPVFHEWFVEMFPEPGAWFTARLRYTRSCAVMSIVGHVLGLGDRHGENILFEEGNGGTFHVDFNCLFDKGLTFEKPELVPFRLTHNMVNAFGAYGYEGPFRKSCELTLGILRQNEDTLMTILETFLYDPTTDFIGKKKKKETIVPDTPEGVLESVNNKVKGLLPMESVPLSVEGYVQALIQQAVDPFRLASMYIGWCAFF